MSVDCVNEFETRPLQLCNQVRNRSQRSLDSKHRQTNWNQQCSLRGVTEQLRWNQSLAGPERSQVVPSESTSSKRRLDPRGNSADWPSRSTSMK